MVFLSNMANRDLISEPDEDEDTVRGKQNSITKGENEG